MARYFFDLSDGAGGVEDDVGTQLADDRDAVTYGYQVAQELMRNNERKCRHFCISVRDDARTLLFALPFVTVDETMRQLPPETRVLVERCCERQRALAEAVYRARRTVLQSRALRARRQGMLYLATIDGDRFA